MIFSDIKFTFRFTAFLLRTKVRIAHRNIQEGLKVTTVLKKEEHSCLEFFSTSFLWKSEELVIEEIMFVQR